MASGYVHSVMHYGTLDYLWSLLLSLDILATICSVLRQFKAPETVTWNLYPCFSSADYNFPEDISFQYIITHIIYIFIYAHVFVCKHTCAFLPPSGYPLSLLILWEEETQTQACCKKLHAHSLLIDFPHTWLCINFRLIPSSVTWRRPPSPVFISCTGNSPPNSGPGMVIKIIKEKKPKQTKISRERERKKKKQSAKSWHGEKKYKSIKTWFPFDVHSKRTLLRIAGSTEVESSY